MRSLLAIAAALLLAACDDGGSSTSNTRLPPARPDFTDPANWQIGPIIDGQNYSVGMPLHPVKEASGGWSFAFPQPNMGAGHVHYVTVPYGSLADATRIVMHYRIVAEDGVQFVPKCCPGAPASIALYIQRRGDDWSGRGKYETYRWYSTFHVQSPITPGDFELSAGLYENWTAVETSSANTKPDEFMAAVRDADRIGFVLGGGDGYGHGVYATGQAWMVVTDFHVE